MKRWNKFIIVFIGCASLNVGADVSSDFAAIEQKYNSSQYLMNTPSMLEILASANAFFKCRTLIKTIESEQTAFTTNDSGAVKVTFNPRRPTRNHVGSTISNDGLGKYLRIENEPHRWEMTYFYKQQTDGSLLLAWQYAHMTNMVPTDVKDANSQYDHDAKFSEKGLELIQRHHFIHYKGKSVITKYKVCRQN